MKKSYDIEMLNAFLRDTFDIIQSVSPDGKFELTNPAWHSALGYLEEDLEKLNLFDIIHPESLDHCMGIFYRVLHEQERVSNFHAKFKTKSNQIVELEGTATPYVVGGKVVSTFTMLRNVTLQNQIKNDLLLQNERLKEIARLQSHQVRGPLATIIGLLKLIELEGIPDKDALEKLKKCTAELDDVVKQIVESTTV